MSVQITLTGLRGDIPLAYLAALGALRALSLDRPDDPPRMSWSVERGAWRPVLHLREDVDQAAITDSVESALRKHCGAEPFQYADNTTIPSDMYRPVVQKAAREATRSNRRCADFVAAFACEALLDREGKVQDTAFRTMSGAGHQNFLESMRTLCEETTKDHLSEALFGPWRYQDEKPSMRWDPVDDRRHALRWKEPAKDSIRTVRGANRLAIEALPLFTTAPVGGSLQTVGFRGRLWSWPIWDCAVHVDVVRSLLALVELLQDLPDRERLRAIGVAAVYRSERLTQGKFRNFSPAQPVY